MERESNLTIEQIRERSEQVKALKQQQTAIDMAALGIIKSILETCENRRLSFSDKEDDDENFTINVFDDFGIKNNYLVDDIRLEKKGVVVLHAENEDYRIWETDKTYTEICQYMLDEIEFEIINNQ